MVSFDFPTDGGTGASTTLVPWRKHYTLHSDNDLACSLLFILVGKLSKPRGNARMGDRKGGTRKDLLSSLFAWSHFRTSCADNVHESQTSGAPNENLRKIICSEDDLRSRIFGSFSVKFLACLPFLGFSIIKKVV